MSLIHEGRKVKAYDCASKEDRPRKLPDLVAGKTQIDLMVEFEFKAADRPRTERRKIRDPIRRPGMATLAGIEVIHARLIPDYGAVLFPSGPDTVEVFRLRAGIAQPAPDLRGRLLR